MKVPDKPDWLDLCSPCKEGVCKYIDQLIDSKATKSVREATRFMEKEVDGKWKADTLRKIYQREKLGTHVPRANSSSEKEDVAFWKLQIKRLERVKRDVKSKLQNDPPSDPDLLDHLNWMIFGGWGGLPTIENCIRKYCIEKQPFDLKRKKKKIPPADELNDDNFEEKVIKCDCPVLVDFYSDGCSPCRSLSPVIDRLATEYKRIKVYKCNSTSSRRVFGQYNIQFVPTLILFKDGKRHCLSSAIRTKAEIRGAISEILGTKRSQKREGRWL